MFLDKIGDLKIIKNDGSKYLGFHEIKEGSCILTNIFEIKGRLGKDDFKDWIMKNNLDETEDIEITNPVNVSISDLTIADKRVLNRMKDLCKEAMEKATGYTVNTVFSELLEELED